MKNNLSKVPCRCGANGSQCIHHNPPIYMTTVDTYITTANRIVPKKEKYNLDMKKKRSKYLNDLVDILDEYFPKGKCKERAAAVMMLVSIELLLQGIKYEQITEGDEEN